MIANETKRCKTCGEEKPLDAFSLHSNATDIKRAHCKKCLTEKTKQRQIAARAGFDVAQIPDSKTCCHCGVSKASNEFTPDRAKSDGLASACKTCKNAMTRSQRWNRGSPVAIIDKKCTQCLTVKPAKEFSRNKRSADGLQSVCKHCAYSERSAGRKKQPITITEKHCSYCNRTLAANAFGIATQSLDGRQGRCRVCSACWHYGITYAQFCDLLQSQNGKCAICEYEFFTKVVANPVWKANVLDFCIDHCHLTGNVRGVLCKGCNTAIGLLGDKSDLVMRAVTYLQNAEVPHG